MAEATNLSTKTISRIETNKISPNMDILSSITSVLGIPLIQFLNENNDPCAGTEKTTRHDPKDSSFSDAEKLIIERIVNGEPVKIEIPTQDKEQLEMTLKILWRSFCIHAGAEEQSDDSRLRAIIDTWKNSTEGQKKNIFDTLIKKEANKEI